MAKSTPDQLRQWSELVPQLKRIDKVTAEAFERDWKEGDTFIRRYTLISYARNYIRKNKNR